MRFILSQAIVQLAHLHVMRILLWFYLTALIVIKLTNVLTTKSLKAFAKFQHPRKHVSPKKWIKNHLGLDTIRKSWNRVYYVLWSHLQQSENGGYIREPSSWDAPGKFPQHPELRSKDISLFSKCKTQCFYYYIFKQKVVYVWILF